MANPTGQNYQYTEANPAGVPISIGENNYTLTADNLDSLANLELQYIISNGMGSADPDTLLAAIKQNFQQKLGNIVPGPIEYDPDTSAFTPDSGQGTASTIPGANDTTANELLNNPGDFNPFTQPTITGVDPNTGASTNTFSTTTLSEYWNNLTGGLNSYLGISQKVAEYVAIGAVAIIIIIVSIEVNKK